eukprot:8873438-Pyramimonas_sp.AAC.1
MLKCKEKSSNYQAWATKNGLKKWSDKYKSSVYYHTRKLEKFGRRTPACGIPAPRPPCLFNL